MAVSRPQRYNTRVRTAWALAAILIACDHPVSVPPPANRTSSGSANQYAAAMSLQDELRGLLDVANRHWPVTAKHVEAYLAPRARSITHSNSNLDHPAWADRVGRPEDTFVELGGDIAGIRIPQDQGHGGGQYAELFVVTGTIEDVEAVVGPLRETPRIHFDSPAMSIAYVPVNGHQLRVLVEINHDTKRMVVMVHYED